MSDGSADAPTMEAADSTATPGPLGAEARFGRGATLGRYVVVDWIGAGGMGVVYKAYDPELDRAVALKLLRGSGQNKQRLLREAQAMARLQHPNVITVHDVGAVGGQVFVAMELVEGEDLGAWCRPPRSRRDAVAAFRDAGRGLAAAHDAGIVHRDFKPGNVLVGRDGRVRVLDFGLAHLDETGRATQDTPVPGEAMHLTQHGAIMGTPHYMAPEQLRGERADARADQFAFALALWEALVGNRPFAGDTIAELLTSIEGGEVREPADRRALPAPLLRALRRGLAADPAARHPDLHAFVAALADDPGGGQRRTIAIGVAVAASAVAAVGITILATRDPRAAATPCTESADRMATVWGAPARDAVRRALPGGDGALVVERLDAYGARWTAAHVEACTATRVRHDYSEAVLDRRNACLQRRLDGVAALTGALTGAVEAATAGAVEAADALRDPESCADIERLMSVVEVPADAAAAVDQAGAQLARAEVALQLGRLPEAREAAAAAAEVATAIGYMPLIARAQATLGEVLDRAGSGDAAAALFAAMAAAIAGRDDEALAVAANHLITVDGRHGGDPDAAMRWSDVAAAVIARLGGDVDLDADRLTSLGLVLADAGRSDAATRALEQAASATERAHGRDGLPYATRLAAFATTLNRDEQFSKARPYAERALEIRERVLGADHPATQEVVTALAWIAWGQGRRADARALYQRALDSCVATAGTNAPCQIPFLSRLAEVERDDGNSALAFELIERAAALVAPADARMAAFVLRIRGLMEVDDRRFAEARVHLQQALDGITQLTGPDSLDAQYPRYYLARAYSEDGDCAHATPLYQQLADFSARALPAGHPLSAYPLDGLAACQLADGDAATALATYERVMVIRDAVEAFPEEKAKTQLGLAQALVATGGDRARARALATQAIAGFRAGGDLRRSAQAQAWLDQNPP